MRIVKEDSIPIRYDMREIVTKILQVLKEDRRLNFGPQLKSSSVTRRNLQEIISSKTKLLEKSTETLITLRQQLVELKDGNDNIREELLEGLGSRL